MRWIAIFALLGAPVAAENITPAALDSLPAADVYVLGEVHDNPVHHLNQARAISALRPAAVVWEMLTAEQAQRMPVDRSDANLVAEALGWDGTGWPEFSLYAPILQAAGAAQHFGAALPRQVARLAFADGAAAVFEGDAERYGLNAALPADQQAIRETLQFDAHCEAMPLDLMPGLVEAQRLRDAQLAQVVVEAFAATSGPVAVITGNGHARQDWGVPAVLQRAAPSLRVVSLGQIEGEWGDDPAPWDLWIITEAHPRNDPCAAFQ